MITDFLSPLLSIIDKIIPDAKQAAEAKLKLLELQQTGELQMLDAQSKVLTAEAQSESWLAKNWRPITMLSFVSIMINNYILAPYLKMFGANLPILAVPPDMWSLLQIGIGGYIFSRGVEKSIDKWKS